MYKNQADSTEEKQRTEDMTRRRGRPVQMDFEAREAAILDAADALMRERGFDKVTMAAIARSAGMSKRTLYEHFDSQEVLLGRVIARVSETMFQPVSPEEEGRPFEDRLRLLLTFNKPPGSDAHKVEFLRTIIARAATYPVLARQLVENGRGRLLGYVRDEITRACAEGQISLAPEKIPLAADLLVCMAFGDPLPKLLDSTLPTPCDADISARRDLAIALFLRGCDAA